MALATGQIASAGESVDFQQCSNFTVDETLRPNRNGESVARAVHSKLVSKLGTDDRSFMINYAFVETEYGSLTFDWV